MARVTALEILCFDQIIRKLEQFKTEDLSLLPKKYRVETLLLLPLVDVCRLEDTQFTADIAMDTIWEQLYERYIGSTTYKKPQESWKDSLLNKLALTILQCGRPYGYFLRKSRPFPDRIAKVCTVSPVDHPADAVNYLIAIKRDTSQVKKSYPRIIDFDPTSEYQMVEQELLALYSHEVMTCYLVTITEGVVLPGKSYQEGCAANQMIPPRHMAFLNPERTFLPNLTALELIKKCGFSLKSMDISLSTFGAFLLHAQNERVDFLESLRDVLSTVESVTFSDSLEEIPRGVKLQDRIEDSSQKLLQQGIETFALSTLKSLAITTAYPHPVINCITPVLMTSPSSLETFTYASDLELPPHYFQQLLSILLHHNSLTTVSIKQLEDDTDLRLIKTPWSVLCLWLEASLAIESLQLLKLHVHSVKSDEFLNILSTFLTAPCSQKQTLSLRIVLARDFNQNQSDDIPAIQLKNVSEKLLQQKSIEFVRHVSFSRKFVPIRFGRLIATRVTPAQRIFPLLCQFITSEVRLNSVNFSSFKTLEDYKSLFKGSLLESIIFDECTGITLPLLNEAATLHGFTFTKVTMETDSEVLMYTATKESL